MNAMSAIRGLVIVVAATAAAATALPRDREEVPRRERLGPPESAPASRPAPPRPGGPRGDLTAQERQELMAFLRQHMPELARQLEALRRNNPPLADRQLRQAEGLYRHIKDFPPEVREAALARQRLNVAILRTARQLRLAGEEDKPRLAEKLEALIAEQFDKDMVVREFELQRLSNQLAKLQEEARQRKANRDKIIQNKLQRARQWSASSQPEREMEPERGKI